MFGDTTPTNNWILDNNGNAGNALALDLVSGTPTITVNNQTATISATLAGILGLQKSGAGTLTLSGSSANTYSGTTTVNAGTLILNKSIATSATIPGNLVIGDGVGGPGADVVQLANSNQISDSLTSTVTINNSGLLNISSFQDYVATLIFNGGAVSTGTGVGQFLGFIGNSGQITSNANAQTATIAGVLNLNDDSTHFTSFGIASGSTPNGIDLDVSAQVVNGGITKTGAGTLRLSNGTSNYTNGTQLNAGTISVGADTVGSPGAITSGPLGTGTVTMADQAAIQADGFSHTLANAISIPTGGSSAIVSGSPNLTLTGAISGNGGLTKNGTGTLTLSGTTSKAIVGTLTINNGTLAMDSNAQLTVGSSTPGTGLTVDAGGNVSINGGSLSPTNIEYIGYNSAGSVTQSGGTNAPAGSNAIYIGYQPGSSGSYTLGGGNVSQSAREFVGYSGTGNFSQSGGSNTLSDFLEIGYSLGSHGTYTLSGGSLTVTGNAAEGVGVFGNGVFTQTGGTNTITGTNDLVIGNFAGSAGSYSISGGSAFIGRDVDIGTFANTTGVLSVSNTGILTVTGTLAVGNNVGTVANLSGGTINTTALNLNGIPANLNWTAGKLNINSNVTWDSAAAGTSTSAAFGASLSLGANQTLMVTGNENLGGTGPFALTLNNGSSHYVTGSLTLNPTGTITQNTGSTLYATTFTQAGGTVNGTLQNQGIFIYQSGQFAGRLLNQGIVSFGSNFTAVGGIENDSSLTVTSGQTLVASFGNLDNFGTLTLNGGAVSASTMINEYGGKLQGLGSISLTNNVPLAFQNFGTLNLSGVLHISTVGSGNSFNYGVIQGSGTIIANAFQNNVAGTIDVTAGNTIAFTNGWANLGLVSLQSASAIIGGAGSLTNFATIEGAGTVNASVVSQSGSTVRALGGELIMAGAGNTNVAGAQIQATAGSTAFYTQGLANNAGTIALTGGAFDNNNFALANNGTGIISGYGTLRTAGLTNTGKLNVGEGNLDIFGSVTNNGTIGIQGGRFVYFFGNVNGSGSFTGLGTPTFLAALSPGNSPASVTFGGNADLTSTATLNIEIGGSTAGTQYDQLIVAGQLTLGGTLQVALINSFNPVGGNSFNILDWGSLSGTFSSIALPSLPGGLTWNTSQLYTIGVLSIVAPGIPGDYNNNGVVDAADDVAWRNNQGTTNVLPNDPIGGTIGAAQYDQWRAHFGQTAGSGSSSAFSAASSAVPEPPASWLLCAWIGLLARRPLKRTQ